MGVVEVERKMSMGVSGGSKMEMVNEGEEASDFMLKEEEGHVWFSGNGVVLYNV